jgi:SEL1 protein
VDGVVVVDAAGDVTATTTSATTATATADADADADADAGASDEAARQAAAVEDAAEKVREVIKSTLDPARANADAADGEALDDDDDAEPDPYEDTPDDWIAVSDALFLLAALVEAGLVPPDAYPIPDAHADDPFFDYGTVSWSSRPVDGAHPAKADPKAWARTALVVSGEMGSSEARLAVADRVYHARGAPAEVLAGPKCETALGWIKPVADEAAKDAEKNEDFQLPRSPGLLRERERDARWVSEDQLENGNEQIFMEEDLAARGVPEAQRHLGYRRLMGRGVERDEAEAFRDFEAAAAAGDELAAFNLGYMHMKGISTPQNFTEARRRFEHAARTNKLPAAFNGLGVLHFNGWGVERNYTAARLAFEAGAARGDPDSNFNLGAIYQNGLGVDMDAKKAVEFYEAASEAGHWRAPHVLAIAHHTGSGTDVNCTRAAELYKTFVDERLGWTRLQDDAMATLDGGPVTDDETQKTTDAAPDAWGALVKYVLLAEQGSASATSNAAWVLRKSKDAVIASSGGVLDRETFFTVAREMLERAVVMGEHESHVDLGDLHWEAVRASGGPRPFVPRSVEEGASNGGETASNEGETASNEGETASNEGETATPSPSPSPPRFPPRDASPEERVYFHYRAASDAGSVEGAVNLAW